MAVELYPPAPSGVTNYIKYTDPVTNTKYLISFTEAVPTKFKSDGYFCIFYPEYDYKYNYYVCSNTQTAWTLKESTTFLTSHITFMDNLKNFAGTIPVYDFGDKLVYDPAGSSGNINYFPPVYPSLPSGITNYIGITRNGNEKFLLAFKGEVPTSFKDNGNGWYFFEKAYTYDLYSTMNNPKAWGVPETLTDTGEIGEVLIYKTAGKVPFYDASNTLIYDPINKPVEIPMETPKRPYPPVPSGVVDYIEYTTSSGEQILLNYKKYDGFPFLSASVSVETPGPYEYEKYRNNNGAWESLGIKNDTANVEKTNFNNISGTIPVIHTMDTSVDNSVIYEPPAARLPDRRFNFHNVKNNCSAKLTAITGATITIDNDVFPDAPFYVTIDNEIMEVTAKNSLTFTVTRINPVEHTPNSSVELRMVAELIKELQNAIPKHNFHAVSVPTQSDDITKGYTPGSMWCAGPSSVYICGFNGVDGAFWFKVATSMPDSHNPPNLPN